MKKILISALFLFTAFNISAKQTARGVFYVEPVIFLKQDISQGKDCMKGNQMWDEEMSSCFEMAESEVFLAIKNDLPTFLRIKTIGYHGRSCHFSTNEITHFSQSRTLVAKKSIRILIQETGERRVSNCEVQLSYDESSLRIESTNGQCMEFCGASISMNFNGELAN